MNKPEDTLIFTEHLGLENDTEPLSRQFVDALIKTIFSPGAVQQLLIETLVSGKKTFANAEQLFGDLRGFFAANSGGVFEKAEFGDLSSDFLQQAERLDQFEKRFKRDNQRYDTSAKRNRNVVYWPNPVHSEHPSSLFEQLPYTVSRNLINKSTPIVSAGSCFASEIAWYFQDRGYNYVVEESEPREASKPESSACWGIIFNTPSFCQLAEKAFGIRQMPRLAEYHHAGQYWQDPFRENVPFSSVEALDANRTHHLEACRRAFLKSRICIITLGLNECWEYIPDGSVLSRNPKTPLQTTLFRHRELSLSENIFNLQTFFEILRKYNPNLELIVSVSPIPFLATGLGEEKHVIVANARSKAILRLAAEEFSNANDGVYYFPSFEMVTHCIENPWEKDQRHVNATAIERVMELFEAMYVSK